MEEAGRGWTSVALLLMLQRIVCERRSIECDHSEQVLELVSVLDYESLQRTC